MKIPMKLTPDPEPPHSGLWVAYLILANLCLWGSVLIYLVLKYGGV